MYKKDLLSVAGKKQKTIFTFLIINRCIKENWLMLFSTEKKSLLVIKMTGAFWEIFI